jgi:hypothetical protein
MQNAESIFLPALRLIRFIETAMMRYNIDDYLNFIYEVHMCNTVYRLQTQKARVWLPELPDFLSCRGLGKGLFSLVRINEELLERQSSGFCLKTEINGRGWPPRWPHDTRLSAKLVIKIRQWAAVAQSV